MQHLSIIGFPRIGDQRQLKRSTEGYFKKKISKEELLKSAEELRKNHWQKQQQNNIKFIPSNDFSFYDTFLDMAFLLNVIPKEYKDLGLDELGTYFAMAKGFQEDGKDAKALPMKKWFNTNYHYMVPIIDEQTQIRVNGSKPFDEFSEALSMGIKTKPVITGPFTFLKLSKINAPNKTYFDYKCDIVTAYKNIFNKFNDLNAEYVQIDEPILVTDLEKDDIELFNSIYNELLSEKKNLKILLQTYFGDVRDSYEDIIKLNFDALGLDFVEGAKNYELIEKFGFPQDKLLFAGIINGKNIWINDYKNTLKKLQTLEKNIDRDKIILNTSCSLLHVPYTIQSEIQMDEKHKKHLAFAYEKLKELNDISRLFNIDNYASDEIYLNNIAVIKDKKESVESYDQSLRRDIENLTEEDYIRKPSFEERREKQKTILGLPWLPTTTIGSFPQTVEIRNLRKRLRTNELSFDEYNKQIKEKIADIIKLQEDIGLDVLVHGEFERNDMVEYFGENLSGFLFTKFGWVQSYGTRCVKPPIIFGDVRRKKPITVEYISYAQSCTTKPTKGMLTGPVTILNWSFPREDISLKDSAYQIALAIKAEVLDLESNGIKIIQIDEAALREKLPLRKQDWHSEYLCWAIKAFRIVHSKVKAETQIHTHMCYSEFEDIIQEIDDMDADVITFEAARSDLSLIDVLVRNNFKTEVGPGVYDIHSPRVPSKDEIKTIIINLIAKLDTERLWVNPDCGLKTRGMEEVVPSLRNMVNAVKELREEKA